MNFRRFSSVNRLWASLGPGESFVFCHEAQNFTRFFGSLASDQSLELVCAFSNDEVAPDGEPVADANISLLHYDAEALRQRFDPERPAVGGKFFVTIYGRWIRVVLSNVGSAPTAFLRAYVRGSVF